MDWINSLQIMLDMKNKFNRDNIVMRVAQMPRPFLGCMNGGHHLGDLGVGGPWTSFLPFLLLTRSQILATLYVCKYIGTLQCCIRDER